MNKTIKRIIIIALVFFLVSISMMPIFSDNNRNSENSIKEIYSKEPERKNIENGQKAIPNSINKEELYTDNYNEIQPNELIYREIENHEKITIKETKKSTKLGEEWLEAETISKIVKIPAGVNYHAYFDDEILIDMPYLDRTAGLPTEAKEAIEKVPNWLKDVLADKFGELAGEEIDVGDYSAPCLADLDGDSDFDLTVGAENGSLYYYENKGTPYVAIWVEDSLMYESVSVNANSAPAFADLDNDNDLDLIIGCDDGRLYHFINNGTVKKPKWEANGTLDDDLGIEINVGQYSKPALADMDGDGDADLTIGSQENMLAYYRNTESGWSYEINFYNGVILTGHLTPALADLSDDTLGKYELTLGCSDGTLHYYEDTGTSGHIWEENPEIYIGLDEKPIKTRGYATPTFADLNGDSLNDLIVGEFDDPTSSEIALVEYYRNQGTASRPKWLALNSGILYNEETQNQLWLNIPLLTLGHRLTIKARNPNSAIAIDYARQINENDIKLADEIGFSIVNTATTVLQRVYPDVFGENSRLIYEYDEFLNYVDIIEKNEGTNDFYTTLKYYINESGEIKELELPKNIYYWNVVHPKLTDEDPTYIDPNTGDPANPLTGRFWREYLFQHADTTWPNDNDDTHEYPHDMSPPLLKEKLEDIEILWHSEAYRSTSGHDNNGLNNKRWFEARYRVLYANMTESETSWRKRGLAINTGQDNDDNCMDRWYVKEPTVLKRSDTDYRMWYAGSDGETYRILYATSDDADGRTWSKQGLSIDVGVGNDKDNIHVRHPTVIFDEDYNEYRMWYSGYDGNNYRIFYATSDDGITWDKQGIALDKGGNNDNVHATEPFVLKDVDNYKMWYTGFDGIKYRILYATSSDGGNWKKEGIAIEENFAVGDPCVIYDEDEYKMWYTAKNGSFYRIYYANSYDALNWNIRGVDLNIGSLGNYDWPYVIEPTVIKDLIDGNVTYKMWYVGYDDYHDQAIEQVGNWVCKTLPLNQQEVDDGGERPIQPVRIAHHHNGNCGEGQDLSTAAGRTALIPSKGVCNIGEDHVWEHFWESGWHQWDNQWSDSISIVDRYHAYDRSVGGWNKDVSAVFAWWGDDHITDVTTRYTPTATVKMIVRDRYGNPVDGARIIFGSHWLLDRNEADLPFLSIWNYTDTNGESIFNLGFNNYSFYVMSRYGNYADYHLVSSNGGDPLYEGENYEFTVVLDGVVPRPRDPRANEIQVQSGKNYKIEINYNVLNGEQFVPNLIEGNFHPQNIPTNSDIDFYVCNTSNYLKYLKGYVDFECAEDLNNTISGHVSFKVPEDDDTWYFIFSNTQPTDTAKVVEIEIIKYVRDFSFSIEYPLNYTTFELGEIINVSGIAEKIVTEIENKINDDKDWNKVTNFDEKKEEWNYELDTKNLDAGTHLITVRASAGGSRYKYKTVYFNLWAIVIEQPDNDSTFNVGENVTISGKTTQYIELDKVELKINYNTYIADYNSTYSEWDYYLNTATLSPGSYTIEAKAYYNKYIVDKASIVINIKDLSEPTIIIFEPKDGEKIKTDTIVLIKGNATDNTGIKKVEVKIDDNNWEIASYEKVTNNWSYEWDTTGESIGEHTIFARATDDYEHFSQEDMSVEIYFHDEIKPEISIEKPKEGEEFSVGKIIEISGTASDNDVIDKVEIEIQDHTYNTNYNSKNENWKYSWHTSELSLGEYEITVTAKDKSGNWASKSVKIKLIDKTPPIIEFNTYLDGSSVSLGETKVISGSVLDNIEIKNVQLKISQTWRNVSFDNEEGTWKYDWETVNLSLGEYEIIAKAVDTSNNENYSNEITLILIDDIPPTISISPLKDSYGVGEVVKIKGKAEDNTGNLTIKIFNGVQWKSAVYDSSKQEWWYDWDTEELTPKTYSIKVKVSDDYDNEAEDSILVNLLDKTPPEIRILKPKDNAKFSVGEIIKIEGTAEDEQGIDFVEISFDGETWDGITFEGEIWSYEWETISFNAGKYNITIKAVDTNGNVNTVTIKIVLEEKKDDKEDKKIYFAIGIIGIGGVVFVLLFKFRTGEYDKSAYDDRYKVTAKDRYKEYAKDGYKKPPPPRL